MGKCWYTIYCKPHKERQVTSYLKSNQIEVYHPTLRVKPVNPRAAKIKSYFPRYVFVNVDIEETGTDRLTWVPGAVGLVKFGGMPAVVPDHFIEALRERIDEVEKLGGIDLATLKRGDSVKIKEGPFKGYDAIFDAHLRGEERVKVLMHWLGREMSLKLNASAVEKRRRRR